MSEANATRSRREAFQPGRVIDEIPVALSLIVVAALLAIIFSDLEPYDETSYLFAGRNALTNGWVEFTSGSTYVDLYFLASRIVKDPVNLYFAGRALSASLFVLLVWAAARLHVPRGMAFAAGAIAVSLPVTYAWPGVANPASGLTILAVAALFRWPRPEALLPISAGVWLAAGSRPELVPLAVIVTVWALAWTIRRIRARDQVASFSRSGVAVGVVVAVGIPLGLFLIHGSPFGGSERSWVAFTQHFATRNANPDEDPWTQTALVTQRSFGDASSLVEAMKVNPGAVAGHVLENARDLPENLTRAIQATGLVTDPFFVTRALFPIVLLIGVMAALGGLWRREHERRVPLGNVIRHHRVGLIFLALVLASSVVPILGVYPRQHYLPTIAGLLMLASVALISRWTTTRVSLLLVQLPISILMVAFAAQIVLMTANRLTNPPALATVARQLNSSDEVRNYLAVETGLEVYAPGLVPLTPDLSRVTTFGQLINEQDVRAALVTGSFRFGPWSNLDGFDDFVADPGTFGFTQAAPGSSLWIR